MPNATNQDQLEGFANRPPELEGGVELQVELVDSRSALLHLRHNGHGMDLRAAYLSVPYPSGLRRLLAQQPEVDAVIVDRLPPGLVRAAEEAGVGVLDLKGHGRMVAPGFVYVVPPPPTLLSAARRSPASPFAPKASRIVRGLLVEPEQHWRLSNLAEAVKVDAGNAHRIFASLVEMGVVEKDEEAYVLSDPGSLLEAWAEFQRRSRERLSLATDDLAGDLRKLVSTLEGQAVVSGEFAAELHAPYLPAAEAVLHCFSQGALESIQQTEPLLQYVPSYGPRSRILVDVADEGAGQFASVLNGLPVAHPVQVYVDLFRDHGRGREAAEHVRRERIPY